MECNKDEAEKCKAIAEASLRKLDVAAAKRFALKAKQLFPGLDGLAQLSAVLDVFAAAQQKLRTGELNWYAILQVDFRADENTIRKQYRKLALFLHPDKNKAFGAETAFKHISEAWSVLSDGKKKSDYDKKWFSYMASLRARSPQSVPPQSVPAFRPRENLSKQQVHGASQLRQTMQQNLLNRQANQAWPRHFHGRQGIRVQQQGATPLNANKQRWEAYAHAYKQQEPDSQQQGKGPEQGHAPSQQPQSQGHTRFHVNLGQHQGNVPGQAQHYSQREERPTHAQRQECAEQNEKQDSAHCFQRQCEDQSTAYTGQPGQGETPSWEHVGDHVDDANSQVQDQANFSHHHGRQQQQRGQGYTCSLRQGESDVRGKANACQKQGDNADQRQSQIKTHGQHARGESYGSLQVQYQACMTEQDHSQDDGKKQQVQNEFCPPRQHEEPKKACLSNSGFSKQRSVFWTACPYCKMQFEYDTVYMNKKLCCPMCYRPFVSKVILPLQGTIIWQRPKQEEASENKSDKRNVTTEIADCIPAADSDDKSCIKGDESVNVTQMKTCKKPEAAVSAKKGETRVQKVGMGVCETVGVRRIPVRTTTGGNPAISSNLMKEKRNNPDESNTRLRNLNLAQTKENRSSFANSEANNSRVRTRNSAKAMETEGLHQGIGSKSDVSEQKRKSVSSSNEVLEGFASTEKRLRRMSNQSESTPKSINASDNHQILNHSQSLDNNVMTVCVADDAPTACEMEVPDSDFYDFDEDRTERHFSVGQIWATYDDDDGMPRYYARVNKILSIKPFKLQMNWLEARNPTDETIAWLGEGFQHICGDFMLGSVYVANQVSTFSHLMTVDVVSKGHYKIYPRKGEVWAVYKGWEFLKVRGDQRGYEIVEIIATYDERKGIRVATLFKVPGFKTIFETKPGGEYTKWIPSHEMRRFSHQVPARLVEPGKVPCVQGNCLEVDPASTPMDLITGIQ